MDGFRAKRTAHHVIEPLGYGLLRKTVRRGAKVNSASTQYEIHRLASDFRSQWLCILPPHSLDSSHSYTIIEHQDCDPLPTTLVADLLADIAYLNEDYVAFKNHMLREGYFVRDSCLLRRQTVTTHPPLFLIDVSLYGAVQGGLVRFPDLPWTYTLFQAELLYGI